MGGDYLIVVNSAIKPENHLPRTISIPERISSVSYICTALYIILLMKIYPVAAAILIVFISFAYGEISIEASIETLRSELKAFNFRNNSMENNSAHFKKYNEYYGLNFSDTEHSIGYLMLPDYKIAVQYFEPKESVGTVTLLHGYYDHAGILKNLIQRLLEENYSVVAFDLPGHGLSGGRRASIAAFDEYTEVLIAINKLVFDHTDPPWFLIGHSTGGSVIIDSLLNESLGNISKIILVSPLIHSNFWEFSRVGSKIAGIFVEEIPRIFRNNSSDAEFLDFIKDKDILQYRKIPLEWVNALYDWNEEIEHSGQTDREVLVLQGTDDTTVDWKYNLDFIKDKIPNSRIVLIDEAEHQMFNERADIKDRVFSTIVDYLHE